MGCFKLILCVLLFSSMVEALSTHYEVDKPYYHPGETGRLLLSTYNDDGDLFLFGAEMSIGGIGVFKWNMSEPLATNLPPNVTACGLKGGQKIDIEIFFKIPENTTPGEYEYNWSVIIGPTPFYSSPFSGSGRIGVYERGVEPPNQSVFPCLTVVLLFVSVVACSRDLYFL